MSADSATKNLCLARLIRGHRWELAAALAILLLGVALRVLPFFGVPDRLTVDEHLYMTNVGMLEQVGPFEYPALVQSYVDRQARMDMVMLPPTRCVYILLGWTWDALFHCGPRMSLRYVAACFSVLSLLLSAVFAFRLGGSRFALVVGALMATSPMELMLAHRELVDGIFAFWALLSLWLLWENLQRPGRLLWLTAYATSITFMVLTKENAFFAAVALGGIICVSALAPGLKLGKPAWSTVAATFAGGLMGVGILICLAGSPQTLIDTYRLLVSKAEKMTFAYDSGGGPWFRYIVDLLLVSPTVLLPAIGGVFALRRENRQGIFLLLFVLFSCAVMVNVKNGMNLRYATMWDMPLRYLAAGTILHMAGAVRRAPALAAALLVAAVGAAELHQYLVIFVRYDVGDPITQLLMYAQEIVRFGPPH
jgi:4-amino-4-deoxy-L-arabinose transferase-like glycosyltransferase